MSKGGINWLEKTADIQTAVNGLGELSLARRRWMQRQANAKRAGDIVFWNRMRAELQETPIMWEFDDVAHPDRLAEW